ncbi:methyltransferase domain-containing protein [Colletotrichum tofieldiae]|nr:methyltransferase domain-containing protein [Colletotrichum tofieldiae]
MADNQIAATADESTALVSVFGSVADPASPSNIGPDRAPNHGPVLEAEAENDASVASSSTSLSSSILQHRLENGRTYHKYKDGNSGVKRVLDVGTGTGLWAIEFADEHPEAEVNFSAVQKA